MAILLTAALYGLGRLVYSQLPADLLSGVGDWRSPGEPEARERPEQRLPEQPDLEELAQDDAGRDLRPVYVGPDVVPPVKIHVVDPTYTEAARKARVTGAVVLRAIIDRQGDVAEVEILKDLPMGLGEAAQAAVGQWKFEPATQDGEQVAVHYTLTVNFRLE